MVLTNLENINAVYIDQGKSQSERLELLNQLAIYQLSTLANNSGAKQLKKMDENDIKKLK